MPSKSKAAAIVFVAIVGTILIFCQSVLAEDIAAAPPYDLQECYKLALETSERLQRNVQDIRIAEAQYNQALAAVYPQLNLYLDQAIRDNSDFGRVTRGGTVTEDGDSTTGGRSGSIGRTQLDGTAVVSQQLFNGFREFLLAKSLEQESEALRLDLERNRELLYQDVAALYHQIQGRKAELEVLDKSQKTIEDRIGELNRFLDLGKSRESEVVAAKSDLQDLLAQREQTLGTIRATMELLAFLVGRSSETITLSGDLTPSNIASLDTYLQRMGGRYDLAAAKQRIDAQKQRVEVASRGLWPQLDMIGSLFPYEDPDRNREWELLFQLKVPVFDGGRVSAETSEERARLRSAGLVAKETRRIIEREVRSTYERATSAQLELKRLNELLRELQRNYDLQRQDYENGVVSNLDVLQAIRRIHDAERRIVIAQFSLADNIANLEVAAGGIPQ